MTHKFKFDLFRRYKSYLQEIEEQQAWAKENAPVIESLKAKLFKIAGHQISLEPYPFLSEIVDHGQYLDFPVKFRRMRRNRCHDNVSLIWQQRTQHSRLKAIVTGYAMSNEDGMWRPHSWGLTGTYILETTVGIDECFGIIMDGEDADAFVAGHIPATVSRYFRPAEEPLPPMTMTRHTP